MATNLLRDKEYLAGYRRREEGYGAPKGETTMKQSLEMTESMCVWGNSKRWDVVRALGPKGQRRWLQTPDPVGNVIQCEHQIS